MIADPKIIKDIKYTSVGFLIQRIFGFLREFFFALWLGPEYFGLRNYFLTLFNMSTYTLLGVDLELLRTSAKIYSTEMSRVKRILESALLYASFVSLVVFFLFLVIGYFQIELFWEYVVIAVAISLRVIASFFSRYYASIGRFKYWSLAETVSVSVSVIVGLVMVYYIGFYGAIFTILLYSLLRFAFYFEIYLKTLKSLWPHLLDSGDQIQQDFRSLVSGGISLFFSSTFRSIFYQMDKLVIYYLLGSVQLGLYSFPSILLRFISSVFNAALMPVFQRIYKGEFSNIQGKLKYLSLGLLLLGLLLNSLYGGVLLDFLPGYRGSEVVFSFLSVALMYLVMNDLLVTVMYSKGAESSVSKYLLLSGLGNLILNLLLIYFGYGILGVAISTAISFGVLYWLLSRDVSSFLLPMLYLMYLLIRYL